MHLGIIYPRTNSISIYVVSVTVWCRYESLCPGNPELVAEFKEKLFCFASEEKLDKFMR